MRKVDRAKRQNNDQPNGKVFLESLSRTLPMALSQHSLALRDLSLKLP